MPENNENKSGGRRRGPISIGGTQAAEHKDAISEILETGEAAAQTAAQTAETVAESAPAVDLEQILPEEPKAEEKPAPVPQKKAEAPAKKREETKPAPKAAEEEPAEKKEGLLAAIKRGVIAENPVLRLVLGTCPTLAVTTQASNAIGMGIAATLVLICSNAVISALRKVIPDKVRIPAYITIIAGFVSVVQMLVKAFFPAIDASLGLFLPLIVVNCIILGRAEMFASKNKVLPSIIDGLAMGIGFTAALLCMGTIREVLGNGSFFGLSIPLLSESPILIFLLPPGGFFVFGMLIALSNQLSRKKGLPVKNTPCVGCPAAATCSKFTEGGECK